MDSPSLAVIVGVFAFAAQALLFLPVVPVLLTAGVWAARGDISIVAAIAASALGVWGGDLLWYAAGRRGSRVIERVCKWSVEPDTCVRRAQRLFGRYGARALLVSKFIPGLSTAALPLAGVFGMRLRRFLTYDAIGALLWTSAYVVVGYTSSRQLADVSLPPLPSPGRTLIFLLPALVLYLLWKLSRRHFARVATIQRISSEDLLRKLQAREPVVIIDLRHAIDFERDPYTVPGATWIPAEEIEGNQVAEYEDREIVLYCTCPDEITSARCAVTLRGLGATRVWVLRGGFAAWRGRGYPVQFVGPDVRMAARRLNVA